MPRVDFGGQTFNAFNATFYSVREEIIDLSLSVCPNRSS